MLEKGTFRDPDGSSKAVTAGSAGTGQARERMEGDMSGLGALRMNEEEGIRVSPLVRQSRRAFSSFPGRHSWNLEVEEHSRSCSCLTPAGCLGMSFLSLSLPVIWKMGILMQPLGPPSHTEGHTELSKHQWQWSKCQPGCFCGGNSSKRRASLEK